MDQKMKIQEVTNIKVMWGKYAQTHSFWTKMHGSAHTYPHDYR